MNLLTRSGAFTWSVREDASLGEQEVVRIHCPARSFLHKLIVNEGCLMTVVDFVTKESNRSPCDPKLSIALAFVKEAAAKEADGIRTHGQEWSKTTLVDSRHGVRN